MWAGVGYAAVQARQTEHAGRYDVYTSPTVACPGSSTSGWTLRSTNVAGPITFATSLDESTTPAGDVLGLCGADGSVTHYRGRIELTRDSSGNSRVVNDVLVENYLRGVVSREVSTSWGNAGGGAGMNALRAQAVAARSYCALAEPLRGPGRLRDDLRLDGVPGLRRRRERTSPLAATVERRDVRERERDVRVREHQPRDRRHGGPGAPVPERDDRRDRVLGVERTAHGGRDVSVGRRPGRRRRRATPTIVGPGSSTPTLVGSAFGLGTITAAATEPDPTAPFVGVWDNRVRISRDERHGRVQRARLPLVVRAAVARLHDPRDHDEAWRRRTRCGSSATRSG